MTDDGHFLRIVLLGDEGWPKFDIDCPGHPTCKAYWRDPDETWTQADIDQLERDRAKEPCWLRYWFHEDDASRECIKGEAEGNGPYPLDWEWNGEYVDFCIGTARAAVSQAKPL